MELVEIPSGRETNDNIVAFWRPAAPLVPGHAISFAYRITWLAEPALPKGLGKTIATRSGASVDGKRRVFLLDFVGAGEKVDGLRLDLGASAGRISNATLMSNSALHGLRASFEIDPNDSPLIELRLRIMRGDTPVTETWLYRWTSSKLRRRLRSADRFGRHAARSAAGDAGAGFASPAVAARARQNIRRRSLCALHSAHRQRGRHDLWRLSDAAGRALRQHDPPAGHDDLFLRGVAGAGSRSRPARCWPAPPNGATRCRPRKTRRRPRSRRWSCRFTTRTRHARRRRCRPWRKRCAASVRSAASRS